MEADRGIPESPQVVKKWTKKVWYPGMSCGKDEKTKNRFPSKDLVELHGLRTEQREREEWRIGSENKGLTKWL